MGSAVKKKLKSLCCENGWCYGVFWRFDGRNSMLLTLEDAYYEQQIGTMLDNTLLQVHMLGEGIIGQAAFTGKHRWMFSDAFRMDSVGNQDILQCDSEIHHQFSSGIKTISVISVEPQGVALFGSTRKILEDVEFLDRTKSLFRDMETVESPVKHNDTSDLSRLFASLISSGTDSYDGNLKFRESDIFDDLGRFCSSSNPSQSSPFMSEACSDLLHDFCAGAQVLPQNQPNQHNFHGEFMPDMSKCYTVDNLSEIFSPAPEQSASRMEMAPNKGVSSVSSSLAESDSLFNIPFTQPGEHDLFDGLGLDFGFSLPGECWEDIAPTISTSVSQCISGLGVASTAGPRNGLFSELGIEELLNGIGNASFVTKSGFEDQGSTSKRRKVNGLSMDSDRARLGSVSCSSMKMNSMQMLCNVEKMKNLAQPEKLQEPAKGARKRARPGESARPRPKDRQQIQDRLTELRKLIPNGHKPPIDVLLDRTVKYMIFLQSVTKYADKLKQADEPKMIDHGNGVVLKDNSREGGGGGVTWAFEVGGQTLVCPIIVEDLNPPGQMLIEMLCEDQGFFLEIADIIRGIGLNILKGVMELRENKIWARFIVETNRHVTRTDIFWSLIQLLQQTGTSRIESPNPPCNILPPPGLAPMSLAETLQ